MSLRAVSLDFWDTVAYYPFTEEIFSERVAHASSVFSRYDISEHTSEKLMRSIYEHFEDIWHNHKRTPTTPEMFRHIEDLVGIKFDNEDFKELVTFNESLITERYFELEAEAESSIRELSEDFRLVIISDTGFEPGREIRNALKNKGMLELFTYGVFSDETGFAKPDVRAFGLAAEKAGCHSSEMIHVGDRENKDISGAKAAGMRSLLFTGYRNDDEKGTSADFTAGSWTEAVRIIRGLK